MAGVGRMAEFDPQAESFGTYSRRMEQFFIANGVKEEEEVRRRAIFLSVVGSDVFSLLEDLIAPATVSSLSYKEIIKLLLGHFEPASSAIVARFSFNRAVREDGESVSAFVARLRRLAKPCHFLSETLEEMLRDRFVCGLQNAHIQAKLLKEQHLSLASAIDIAQLSEAADADASLLSGAVAADDVIHAVSWHGARRGGAGGRGGGRGRGRGGWISSGQQRNLQQPSPRTGGEAAIFTGSSPGRVRGGGDSGRRRGVALRQPQCPYCLRQQHAETEDCPARRLRCYRCHAVGHVRAACRAGWSPRVYHLDDDGLEAFRDGGGPGPWTENHGSGMMDTRQSSGAAAAGECRAAAEESGPAYLEAHN
ncbi:uncharacterized protein LOC122375785 [Amphibalanus amphitrite]|uniref:uncharacterized protein LOC122375785 n=1 Tax=Amphibalanus amphitrite TaxID=1232801 RepID=UPI001C903EB0|nr:uncharacterized protein LOC122375785 [Amphibalanus amphitrite]